jgi:hypothetical protein
MKICNGAAILLFAGTALAACDAVPEDTRGPTEVAAIALATASQAIQVSGSGIHYFSTAIVHSQEPTETGMIQRSTDIVELEGDLSGYLIYHATSTFDFVRGTLVNIGTQIFSGTVAGSTPVLLHDNRFRFEVDLGTGEGSGTVHLGRSNDAPHKGGWYECDLQVVTTGLMPSGDGAADYSGVCRRRGNLD